ncbi:hypothetical protein SKAU_G00249610 [Synaphobranchus kaupii]|uniref:Uncharacterized protein n=1 Tax=Synaphobranchus kaupii TaxID=118154 RepID=A0A9Q1F2P3_SYNKA|nr:hypothetical protein SKAU_G00249610 [Synaphobranchus kaupii]
MCDALAHQGANITGGLYSCDITTQLNDCSRVQIDNEVDLKIENKENQWMGVTVQSQGPGGKIVTCAHRYQRRHFVNTPQESRDITGRCYILSEDLSISSEEDGGLWKFCEGRGAGHERFGFCQQGLSATFTKDYHYAVFGAPGAYSWKGIVRVEQRNSTLLDLGYFDDGPYEVGDENRLDPDLVPVPQNSYLGFSVDTGKSITRKGQLTVVSGAPRAMYSGAVVLLRKESGVSLMLSEEFILEGPGLASSFGYDVAVIDLNGDGWQDIAVGAPQFFVKDGVLGGAVFVYINQEGQWDRVVPIPLYGPKDSMFGLAVENIGDMTQDSYEDMAVGAPYDEAGAGRVYIYHGSSDGITTTPAQEDVQDRMQPISIHTTVSIQSIRRRKRQSSLPELLPVLNSNQPSKIISEVGFLKDGCGTDNICQSNLQIQYKFFYRDPSKDEFWPLPVEDGVPVMSLSEQKDIALEVTVTNKNGEDAHDARLVGSFPPALRYSAFHTQRATDKQLLCVANQNGSQTNCALGNPFKRDSEVIFYILLTPGDISLNTTEIEIDLQFTT